MNKYEHLIKLLLAPKPPLILTATRRQARHLRREFVCQLSIKAKQDISEITQLGQRIIAFNEWLLQLWQHLVDAINPPLLLTSCQSQHVWRQIVNNSTFAETLLSGNELANLAYQAWSLLQQWDIPPTAIVPPHTLETEVFLALSEEFERELSSLDAIDEAQLPNLLGRHLPQLHIEPSLVLYGFDDIPPSIANLLDKFNANNIQLREFTDSLKSKVVVRKMATPEMEWRLAAEFAANLIARNNSESLAIVVPDLAANRSQIDRIFREILAPVALFDEGVADLPYTLSSGVLLSEVPVCRFALKSLQLVSQHLNQEDCSSWLNSAYLTGFNAESVHRAKLDVWFRENNVQSINLLQLLDWIDSSPWAESLSVLKATVSQVVAKSAPLLKEKSKPSIWLNHFTELLATLGWPGEQPPDSYEYQAISQLHEVFKTICTLDEVSPCIHFDDALSQVEKMAGEKLFQMEAEDQPIQILGQLEAAGLQFDYLWVTGLTDDIWPAKPKPNPLLPADMQRQFGMPHSSSERELAFANLLTQRYIESAPNVIFSYAEMQGSVEKTVSPLLEGYPLSQDSATATNCEPDKKDVLDAIIDVRGLKQVNTKIKSGAAVLINMAACPFKAYAKGRLQARVFENKWFGLSPRQRGIVMHRVYELFWQKVINQETLKSLSKDKLSTIVNSAVNLGINEFTKKTLVPLAPKLHSLEKERLIHSMTTWLDVELQRAPFTVIACEKQLDAIIAGYQFSLRIDRVDRLTDGQYVIIDYKISKHSIASWAGERPNDMQLPIYSILLGDEVAAIAFAELSATEKALNGVARDEAIDPTIKPLTKCKATFGELTWSQLHQHWQTVSEKLIRDYVAGEASCAPKSSQTCRMCDLLGLCRYQSETI